MARILSAAAICVVLAVMLASPLQAHVLGNCTVQSHDGFANVRARPTTRAPILLRLQNGTRVSAYGVHHRWLWIKETIGTKETMTGTGWARRGGLCPAIGRCDGGKAASAALFVMTGALSDVPKL
jgi:hypothetical protein